MPERKKENNMIGSSNNYRIWANRERRFRTDYIILTHLPNLEIKDHLLPDDMKKSRNKYTWNQWQKYFIKWGNDRKLPVHYFIEMVDHDWAVMKGLEDTKPSYYLDELVSQGIVEGKYRNAVVVFIGENYDLRNLDPRCIEHLSSKVLVPLVKRFKLSWDRIMYLDECLTESFVNSDFDTTGSRWMYEPMKNFDMVRVRNIYSLYDKYMDK